MFFDYKHWARSHVPDDHLHTIENTHASGKVRAALHAALNARNAWKRANHELAWPVPHDYTNGLIAQIVDSVDDTLGAPLKLGMAKLSEHLGTFDSYFDEYARKIEAEMQRKQRGY